MRQISLSLSEMGMTVTLYIKLMVDLLGTAPSLPACKAGVLTSITIGPYGANTPSKLLIQD